MAVLATQNFDALSESQTINTAALGAPWSVYVGAANPVAQASAANHGARGAYIEPATGAVRLQWDEAQTVDTRVLSWYFRVLVDGAANTYLASLSDSGTTRADWRINSDRTVTLRNAGIATGGASPEVLAMNTWYRAEWMTSASGQELRIYEGESETPYLTRIGALTNNLHTQLTCGVPASPNGHSLHIDTVRVGTDWLGPYDDTPPVHEPTAYYYSGGDWVPLDKPVVVGGASLLPATTKLALIGDSLTERANGTSGHRESATRTTLQTLGLQNSNIYWYGRANKDMTTADTNSKTVPNNISDARTLLGSVQVWVVALGTNNTSGGVVPLNTTDFGNAMRAILDAIYTSGAVTDRVLWVNTAFYDPASARSTNYNLVINTVIAEYPHAQVLNWHSSIHPRDDADWIYPADGVHMTTQGYTKRDQFIAAQVGTLLG